MRKSILTLMIAGILTIGGSVIAFASTSDIRNISRIKGDKQIQILVESGMSLEDAKAQVIAAGTANIDTKVANGEITIDEAERAKTKFTEKIENCDGTAKQKAKGRYSSGLKSILSEVSKVKDLVEGGMSLESAKEQVLQEGNTKIDEAMGNGTITEEEAASLKNKLQEKIDNCTGECPTKEGNKGKGNGEGSGRGKNKVDKEALTQFVTE